VHEGDAAPAGASARDVVHQAITGRPTGRQRCVEIGHAVADVVDAGTTALEELGDGAVRGTRRQQLDLGFPERQ